jgi:hypothetical protein
LSTLASVIVYDLIANLPAAGIPGRLFFASDTGAELRDNGTTWDTVAAGGGGGTFLEEKITFTGTSGAFAHTPVRLYGLYRNGVRMTALAGSPTIATFSATGTAITLLVAAGGSDVFIAVYQY